MLERRRCLLIGVVLVGAIIVVGSLCLSSKDRLPRAFNEENPTLLSIEDASLTVIPDANYCVSSLEEYESIESVDEIWKYRFDAEPTYREHYYIKTQVIYEGQDVQGNRARRDYYGNFFFLFRQGGQIYRLAVGKFIELAMRDVHSGAKMTIFVDYWRGDFYGPSEAVVQDFAIGESLASKPDFHWWVEIVQNGNEYPLQRGGIVLENRPFTIRVYLPRWDERFPVVRMNARLVNWGVPEGWVGAQLDDKCQAGLREIPDFPFCFGNSRVVDFHNGGRLLVISKWVNMPLVFENCFLHSLDAVKVEQSFVVYEKDVLYYSIDERENIWVASGDRKPISELSEEKVILVLFVDIDGDRVIDENELKKGTLSFDGVP